MHYRMPSYYRQFHCVAKQCEDTCCAGWGIAIDEKTLNQYKKLDNEKKEYVFRHIDVKEKMFTRCNGRCSFLNDNNLCDLILNVGEKCLCKTCDRYPRHFEEYGDLLEAALSISCPVVARMILENKEKDHMLVKENDKKSPYEKDVDTLLLAGLLDVRNHLFHIIQNRNVDIFSRMEHLLIFGKRIQKPIYSYEKHRRKYLIPKNGAHFLVGLNHLVTRDKLAYVKKLDEKRDRKETLKTIQGKRQTYMFQYMDMLYGLEQINGKWKDLTEDIDFGIYQKISDENYLSLVREFNRYMKDREYEYEHLLYYFIYTYFLGGVYDYNVHAMIKFAVYSTMMIQEIGLHIWFKQGKNFSLEDQVRVSYLYSREVEHSDDNLKALEGILNAHPLFDNENMILCLKEGAEE